MRVQVISAAVMLALLSRAPGRAQSAAAATCPSAVSPRRAGNPYGCQGEAAKFSDLRRRWSHPFRLHRRSA